MILHPRTPSALDSRGYDLRMGEETDDDAVEVVDPGESEYAGEDDKGPFSSPSRVLQTTKNPRFLAQRTPTI